MSFSTTERLILSNQYRILETLIPDEAKYFAEARKIVEDGYVGHYSQITQNIGDELPANESSRVLNVLEMFSTLTLSFQRLEDKAGLTEHDVRFPGFDGNYEVELLSYCSFFLDDLDRFDELQRDTGYNSHMPTREWYDEMLNRFASIRHTNPLTADQIKQVLGK